MIVKIILLLLTGFWLGWIACAAFLAIDTRARWKELKRIQEGLDEMRAHKAKELQ